MYIAIKYSWGWTIKEYTGEVPADLKFKVFNTRAEADAYIEDQQNDR